MARVPDHTHGESHLPLVQRRGENILPRMPRIVGRMPRIMRTYRVADIPEIASDTTDLMLTTIVNGIRPDRPDPIRLAAAHSPRNSLAFTQKNMNNEMERNMIMKTICVATQSPSAEVSTAAYECIVMTNYRSTCKPCFS